MKNEKLSQICIHFQREGIAKAKIKQIGSYEI